MKGNVGMHVLPRLKAYPTIKFNGLCRIAILGLNITATNLYLLYFRADRN
jgi:hypothetical protein